MRTILEIKGLKINILKVTEESWRKETGHMTEEETGIQILLLQSHGTLCKCNEYTFRPTILTTEEILSSRMGDTIILIDSIHNIDIYLHFRVDVNRMKDVNWHWYCSIL